jgi:hypothetical protein
MAVPASSSTVILAAFCCNAAGNAPQATVVELGAVAEAPKPETAIAAISNMPGCRTGSFSVPAAGEKLQAAVPELRAAAEALKPEAAAAAKAWPPVGDATAQSNSAAARLLTATSIGQKRKAVQVDGR